MIEDDLKRGRLPCVVATSSLELGIDMGAVDLVDPDRVAAVGRQRPAARRSGRPPGRRGVARGAVPQAPRRPGADGGRRRADAHRRHRGAARAGQPARRARPADRRGHRAGRLGRRRASSTVVRRSAPFAAPAPVGVRRDARPAGRPLPERRVRRAAARARLGPRRRRAHRPAGRPAAGRHQRRHHPRPRAVRRLPGRASGPRGSASSTRRWSTSPGSATCSRSAPRAGGSRTSPTTGCWSPRPRPARAAAVLERRRARPARRARCRGRRVHPRGRRAVARREALARATGAGLDDVGGRQPGLAVRGAARGHRRRAERHPLVVERFRDELGDWRHHRPLAVRRARCTRPGRWRSTRRLRERYGIDAQAMAADDGIVLRIPETDQDPPGADLIAFEPDEIEQIVTTEVGGSALFASRFRECAARALLLPRRDPGRRSPLWQQRQKSSPAARGGVQVPVVPDHPRGRPRGPPGRLRRPGADRPAAAASQRARCGSSTSTTQSPSPFARSLLFGYVAAFMYEGDSPLAERRAAALTLDQGLLAELLGRAELRELLDPEVLAEVETELQRLADDRKARDAEGLVDLFRLLGPLSTDEVAARCTTPGQVTDWLSLLAQCAPRGRGARGRRGALGGRRGRRPAARRSRRAGAARHSRRLHRSGRRPAGRPRGAVRPHPRALRHRRRGDPARARRGRRPADAGPARGRRSGARG